MGDVNKAMRRHQAEQHSQQASDAGSPEAPQSGPVSQAESRARQQTPEAQLPGTAAGAMPIDQAPTVPPPDHGAARIERFTDEVVAHHRPASRITEQYRALRTSLLARTDGHGFCGMVTSAEPGEGKTVTTANLALVMAELPEMRCIVVDCDLRKARLGRLMNARDLRGLAEVLRGEAPLAEVIARTDLPNLFVLPAGQARNTEVGALVGVPKLREVVEELSRQFDVVLIDTPPVNEISDAGILGRVVKKALVVVRLNRTSREAVGRAIRALRAANVEPVGTVLTHQKYFIPRYLYRYS